MVDEVSPETLSTLLDSAGLSIGEVTEVITEAKKTYSLADRVRNIKRRTARTLIYLDLDALDTQLRIDNEQQNLNNQIVSLRQMEDAGSQKRADELQVKYDALDDKLEAAKQVTLESAAGVHMVAIPQVGVDSCRREARKRHLDPITNTVLPEDQQDYIDTFSILLLQKCITRIAFVDGEADGLTNDVIDEFCRSLHPTQWTRLRADLNNLLFAEALIESSTDDPGF